MDIQQKMSIGLKITNNAQQEKFTTDELIAHLIDAEYDDRYNKKLNRLIKQARFTAAKTLATILALYCACRRRQ